MSMQARSRVIAAALAFCFAAVAPAVLAQDDQTARELPAHPTDQKIDPLLLADAGQPATSRSRPASRASRCPRCGPR